MTKKIYLAKASEDKPNALIHLSLCKREALLLMQEILDEVITVEGEGVVFIIPCCGDVGE